MRRAREITLNVDGKPENIWTTALTVDEALQQTGLAEDVHVSASRSERLPLDGTELDVALPQAGLARRRRSPPPRRSPLAAPTVREFLEAAG
ncbi:ubiquitin-like domain-containing protein, partial [Rhodococcus sp. BS-15]|uniref:ubiquitin-like domain-containing protein n=1 Tax=Rhodococcus sp. BS-15 TaxID=1304954 RepID=UPI0035B53758